jgi:hypothetical protein
MNIKNGDEAIKLLRDLQSTAKSVRSCEDSVFDDERDMARHENNEILDSLESLAFEEEKTIQQALMTFHFETGDTDLPYYTISIVIEGNFKCDALHDGFTSYFDISDEDEDYEDSVDNVMNQSGLVWHIFNGPFRCDAVYDMFL